MGGTDAKEKGVPHRGMQLHVAHGPGMYRTRQRLPAPCCMDRPHGGTSPHCQQRDLDPHRMMPLPKGKYRVLGNTSMAKICLWTSPGATSQAGRHTCE